MSRISSLIRSSTQQFPVSDQQIRIGLVQFDSNMDTLHQMQDTNKQALITSLGRLKSSERGRDIPKVLSEINKVFLRSKRSGVKRRIVLFVNGPADDVNAVQLKQAADSLRDADIEVLVINVGIDVNKQLDSLVKTQDNIQRIPFYRQMPLAFHSLLTLDGVKPDDKKPCEPSLYFSFSNTSQTILLDDSGHGNNGAMQDDVSISNNAAFCAEGARFRDGLIKINGAKFEPKPATAVTIATWVKLDSIGRTHELFVTVDPGWRNPRLKTIYNLEVNFDGSIQFTHRNVFGKRSAPVVRANVWTHIAGTYDSVNNEVNIFVNGSRLTAFVESDPAQDNVLSSDWGELTAIGRLGYGTDRSTRKLQGMMDEFYLFPCALSAKQITGLKEKKCITKPKGPCAVKKCSNYAECKVDGTTARCVCPNTCPENVAYVCANNGQTYPNECHLRIASCKAQQQISVAAKGECEYNAYFGGSSYVGFNIKGVAGKSIMQISLKPEYENGLLLYTGLRRDGKGDFASLSLIDGFLEFRFDLGKGPALIRSKEKLSLNEWHEITASRIGSIGELKIGNKPPIKGRPEFPSLTQLNVNKDIYLGFIPQPSQGQLTNAGTKLGFRGCIKQLVVNGYKYSLKHPGPDVKQESNVLPNCGISLCSSAPCLNGAACIVTSANTFRCQCQLGYKGIKCEHRVFTLPQLPAYFNGKTSFVSYRQLKDNKRKMKFSMEFRAERNSGLLLYSQGPKGVRDYFMVALDKSKIVVSYDLGAGNVTTVSELSVRLNTWTMLNVTRENKIVQVLINGRRVARAVSPGKSTVSNLHTVMFIGKSQHLFKGKRHPAQVYRPFQGCVRMVVLANHQLKFRHPGTYTIESNDIGTCANCYKPASFVFLLDNSINIGSDGFAKSKDFIKAVAEYFDSKTTNIAVMDVARIPTLEIPFEPKRKTSVLKSRIISIAYRGVTDHSIQQAYSAAAGYFDVNGINPQQGKFIVLITAAQPKTTTERTLAAFWPRLFAQKEIKVFVVGAGSKVNKVELQKYSSGEEFIFVADDFDDIVGFVTKIRTASCRISSRY